METKPENAVSIIECDMKVCHCSLTCVTVNVKIFVVYKILFFFMGYVQQRKLFFNLIGCACVAMGVAMKFNTHEI